MSSVVHSAARSGSGRWRRRAIVSLVGVSVGVCVAYFIATRSAVLKSIVLPRVSQALGARVTAESISLSPFSRIEIARPVIDIGAPAPVFAAQWVRVRYDWMSLLRGQPRIHEVHCEAPVVEVHTAADGSAVFDQWLRRFSEAETRPGGSPPSAPAPAAGTAPMQLSIRDVRIAGGGLRWVRTGDAGARQEAALTALNFRLDRLENGSPGRLKLDAALRSAIVSNQVSMGEIEARVEGEIEVGWDPGLLPERLSGKGSLAVAGARGVFGSASNTTAEVEADLASAQLRTLALRIVRGGQPLATVRAGGRLNIEAQSGELEISVEGVDGRALNLAGGLWDLDFGRSQVGSTNLVRFDPRAFSIRGQTRSRELSLRREAGQTPALDLDLDYDVAIDWAGESALVRALMLSARQNRQEVALATLSRPMRLHWGAAEPAAEDSMIRVQVKQLRIEDWLEPVTGPGTQGVLGLDARVAALQNGRRLELKLQGTAEGIRWPQLAESTKRLSLTLDMESSLEELNRLTLKGFNAGLTLANDPLLQASVSGGGSLKPRTLQASVEASAAMGGVLGILTNAPLPGLTGQMWLRAAMSSTNEVHHLTGTGEVSDLSGSVPFLNLTRLPARLRFDARYETNRLTLQPVEAEFGPRNLPGGALTVRGTLDPAVRVGRLSVEAADVNPVVLRPFIEPPYYPTNLAAALLRLRSEVELNPVGQTSALRSTLLATNVIFVRSGTSQPLPARYALAAATAEFAGDAMRLASGQIDLAPTPVARNSVSVTGRFRFTREDAVGGELVVRSAGLDLTPWYEGFAAVPAGTNAAAAGPGDSAAAPTEPEAIPLAFHELTVDARLDRIHLREIALSNVVAVTRISNDIVRVAPFEMNVNGAPVKARGQVNVGVAGFEYEANLETGRIPMAPIVNSLSELRRGRVRGELLAQLQIQGKGTTGANLRRHLSGQGLVNFTNANIEIVSPQSRTLLMPVVVLLKAPDVLDSPLNSVSAVFRAGQGRVEIGAFDLESPALHAHSKGSIPIADLLTESPLNLPFDIALRQSIAQKSGFLRQDASDAPPFVQLPRFATLAGTLGKPEVKTDKAVIAGLLLRSTANLPGIAAEKASGLIEGIGNILSGGNPKPAEAPAGAQKSEADPKSGAPAAAEPGRNPVNNLLNTIGGLLNRGAPAPAGTSNPAPADPPAAAQPAPKPAEPPK